MEHNRYLPCKIKIIHNIEEFKEWDTICAVDKNPCSVLKSCFSHNRQYDADFDKQLTCFYNAELNSRVVYSPVGELSDYDDVRVYGIAAGKAIKRAHVAGSKAPIIILPENQKYENAALLAFLGVLKELYVTIQYREALPKKSTFFTSLGVYMENKEKLSSVFHDVFVFYSGLYIARDIGVGDPERMAPPRITDYINDVFPKDGPITIKVITGQNIFTKQYPLFAAVNRAANIVERHQGRIVFLEYKPPNPAKKTLMLVGKGVTYDTGGADVKAGGVMAGMSRDKCGAANVAGFMKVVSEIKPKDIHVIGVLCLVRNSIGEECYVADELIVSRAGCRVRVGNTDAEGRMCMADALAECKEMVEHQNLPDPHLFTIATLTGHACLAVGAGYSICIDNGPASLAKHSYKLKENGEKMGDPFEISTLRQEDFKFHGGKCHEEDVLQCNNLPSSRTPRGSITPAAFLILASGLDKNGISSEKPIKYTHVDIAASAGDFPEIPTGSAIMALAKTHLY